MFIDLWPTEECRGLFSDAVSFLCLQSELQSPAFLLIQCFAVLCLSQAAFSTRLEQAGLSIIYQPLLLLGLDLESDLASGLTVGGVLSEGPMHFVNTTQVNTTAVTTIPSTATLPQHTHTHTVPGCLPCRRSRFTALTAHWRAIKNMLHPANCLKRPVVCHFSYRTVSENGGCCASSTLLIFYLCEIYRYLLPSL